jgi:hypothetical protein
LQEFPEEKPEEPVVRQVSSEPPQVPPPPLEEELIDEEGLPDWLQEFGEETEVPEPVAEMPPQPVPDEEIPSWLEEEIEEEPPTPEPGPTPVPASPAVPAALAASVDQEEMPNWLQKLREQEQPTTAPPAPTQVTPAPVMAAASAAPSAPAEPEDGLPADAGERLKLARLARDKGDLGEAVRVYDSLISSGMHLDRVIDDLEQTIKSYPSNYMLFQLMGDAMMKDGRLQSALDVYRQALAKL